MVVVEETRVSGVDGEGGERESGVVEMGIGRDSGGDIAAETPGRVVWKVGAVDGLDGGESAAALQEENSFLWDQLRKESDVKRKVLEVLKVKDESVQTLKGELRKERARGEAAENELMGRLDELHAVVKSLEDKLEEKEEEIVELERRVDQYKHTQTQLTINSLHNKIGEKDDHIADLERQIDLQREQLKEEAFKMKFMREEHLTEVGAMRAEFDSIVTEKDGEITHAKERSEDLDAKLEEAQERLAVAKETIAENQAERRRLEQEGTEFQNTASERQEQIEQGEQANQELRELVESQTDKIGKLEEQVEKLAKEVKESNFELIALRLGELAPPEIRTWAPQDVTHEELEAVVEKSLKRCHAASDSVINLRADVEAPPKPEDDQVTTDEGSPSPTSPTDSSEEVLGTMSASVPTPSPIIYRKAPAVMSKRMSTRMSARISTRTPVKR